MRATPHSKKGTGHTTRSEDFWLVYQPTDRKTTLADALHALYYLPPNYKLMILSNGHAREVAEAIGHEALAGRIHFQNTAESGAKSAPFSFGHAVIADTPPDESQGPVVVVSAETDIDLTPNSHQGFTVAAGNPPALASAILNIARAAA